LLLKIICFEEWQLINHLIQFKLVLHCWNGFWIAAPTISNLVEMANFIMTPEKSMSLLMEKIFLEIHMASEY